MAILSQADICPKDVTINFHLFDHNYTEFPSKVLGVFLQEALNTACIECRPLTGMGNFQISFENFDAFRSFCNTIIPFSKICTESVVKPLSIQFSFDHDLEDDQTQFVMGTIQPKLHKLGVILDLSFTTGVYKITFPNAEFLFIFAITILQNLSPSD